MAGLGGFERPTPAPYEPVGPARINVPDFNPFAALGLHPATTTTTASIRPAFIRAMRHRHESATARFPATAARFPSQVQVQLAFEYLSSAEHRIQSARRQWAATHRDVFFPALQIGNPGVFVAASPPATPTAPSAGSSAVPPPNHRHRRPAAASPPSPSPFFRPRPAAASATGPGSSPQQPFNVDSPSPDEDEDYHSTVEISSDDDDDGGNDHPSAPASGTGPRPTPSTPRGSGTTPRRASAPARRATPSSASNQRQQPRRASQANRSGGNSSRNARIVNPVLNDRIRVGEWANSAGAVANAVVAGFDARGRMYYRILNESLQGLPVAAANTTATRFEDIVFRAPYQGMTAGEVRTAVDAHLRLHQYQRP